MKSSKKSPKSHALVAIVMGSDSDYPTMKEAETALDQFGVSYTSSIVSAHRTPQELFEFATHAANKGFKVVIAGAGGAAHLPGMVASLTSLPVIGVPVEVGVLKGQDALLSIVQMPKGVPVATVAIGNAFNAGILAAQIIGTSSLSVQKKISSYKEALRQSVLKKRLSKS